MWPLWPLKPFGEAPLVVDGMAAGFMALRWLLIAIPAPRQLFIHTNKFPVPMAAVDS
jgi:hypothetical protein